MPERIQLRRKRHWMLPPNTISVGRPTNWGNPYVVRPDLPPGQPIGCLYISAETAETAVEAFRGLLARSPSIVEAAQRDLAGRNLACWCPLGAPCHADVLLEIANA
jgi:hypothetical protein